MTGYYWTELPIYHSGVDGETKYGISLGLLRRSFVGGSLLFDSYGGSRSLDCYCLPTAFSGDLAARGCINNNIILEQQYMRMDILMDTN